MNIYAVYFKGEYPVGAVAITRADSERQAAEQVHAALPSYLKGWNSSLQRFDNSVEELEKTAELFSPGDTTSILLDGSY